MVCLFLAEPVLSQHSLCNSNLIRILCDSLLKPYSFSNPLQFRMSCPLLDLRHMLLPLLSAGSQSVPLISHWLLGQKLSLGHLSVLSFILECVSAIPLQCPSILSLSHSFQALFHM